MNSDNTDDDDLWSSFPSLGDQFSGNDEDNFSKFYQEHEQYQEIDEELRQYMYPTLADINTNNILPNITQPSTNPSPHTDSGQSYKTNTTTTATITATPTQSRLEFLLTVPNKICYYMNGGNIQQLMLLLDDILVPNCILKTASLYYAVEGRENVKSYINSIATGMHYCQCYIITATFTTLYYNLYTPYMHIPPIYTCVYIQLSRT